MNSAFDAQMPSGPPAGAILLLVKPDARSSSAPATYQTASGNPGATLKIHVYHEKGMPNGVQDAGEESVDGLALCLPDGTRAANTGPGEYTFSGLPAGAGEHVTIAAASGSAFKYWTTGPDNYHPISEALAETPSSDAGSPVSVGLMDGFIADPLEGRETGRRGWGADMVVAGVHTPHQGIDFEDFRPGAVGSTVFASAPGVISFAGVPAVSACGGTGVQGSITERLADGTFLRYVHVIPTVSVGQVVRYGSPLGGFASAAGDPCNDIGPHVHLNRVVSGIVADPTPYLIGQQ